MIDSKQIDQDSEINQLVEVSNSIIESWMLDNFPLLFESEIIKLEEQEIELFLSHALAASDRPVDLPERIEERRLQVKDNLFRLRNEQFDKLIDTTYQNDNPGENARQALIYILKNSGLPFPAEDRDAAMVLASGTIAELCKRGMPGRFQFFEPVSFVLGNFIGLAPQCRLDLLSALREFIVPDEDGASLSRMKLAEALMKALELELARFSFDQNLEFENRLIDTLVVLNHPGIEPVLEAMSVAHPNHSMRDRACKILMELRDCVLPLWDSTVADQVADPEKQAERLSTVPAEDADEDYSVGIIFECAKSSMHAYNDARILVLVSLLSNQSQKVQLAAAIALAYGPPASSGWKQAIEKLSDLALNSYKAGYAHDAIAVLQSIKQKNPEQSKQIDESMAKANLSYLQNRLRSATGQTD